MSALHDKRKKGGKTRAEPEADPNRLPREDLPDPDSIIAEEPFTSPKGNKYRIIVTNETDPYDEPQKPPKKRRK